MILYNRGVLRWLHSDAHPSCYIAEESGCFSMKSWLFTFDLKEIKKKKNEKKEGTEVKRAVL